MRVQATGTPPWAAWILMAVLVLRALPGQAASSDWIDDEAGSIRLVALAPDDKGVARAALELQLNPGWKTYWIEPGSAGIAPALDFRGSDNFRQVSIGFPPPERFDDGPDVSVGYPGPIAFPISYYPQRPDEKSLLRADIFLGLCKELCIPFQARLETALMPDDPGTRSERRIVAAAFDSLAPPARNGFLVESASYDSPSRRLVVQLVHPPGTHPPELFVGGPPGWIFGVPQPQPQLPTRTTYLLDVIDAPEKGQLSGHLLRIVATGQQSDMETVQQVL